MSSLLPPWERKAVDHTAEIPGKEATGWQCEETKDLICPREALRAGDVTTADVTTADVSCCHQSCLRFTEKKKKKGGKKKET